MNNIYNGPHIFIFEHQRDLEHKGHKKHDAAVAHCEEGAIHPIHILIEEQVHVRVALEEAVGVIARYLSHWWGARLSSGSTLQ